ncbi:DUF6527 family protein [Variovorax sp. DAIF25]|uniref:DUF6527 family protein n=1 Tax=Variovorax sp. DAIF25 TaxID=3080983 RepID=UPI003D6AF36D
MKWITHAFTAISRWLRSLGRAPREQRFRLQVFEERARAVASGRSNKVVALFRSGGANKWCFFVCPCGCGQQVALNLMKGHQPSWRVVSEEQGPSIFPSVDSTTCGAHFLVRDGRVIWC